MSNDEVIVFDVNETLLDLSALKPRFENVLPGNLMSLWFSTMLRNSMVATMTGTYAPFDRQGIDALLSTASKVGAKVTEAQAEEVLAGMNELPPHSDVIPALEQLSRDGHRMATLTNSSSRVLSAQIQNAGLGEYFESLLSVEKVGLFKPAPETYRFAADQLGIPINRIRLVAAHDWDVTGAIRAGARAAFVARGGAILGSLSEIPDIIGPDLIAIANAIQSQI